MDAEEPLMTAIQGPAMRCFPARNCGLTNEINKCLKMNAGGIRKHDVFTVTLSGLLKTARGVPCKLRDLLPMEEGRGRKKRDDSKITAVGTRLR